MVQTAEEIGQRIIKNTVFLLVSDIVSKGLMFFQMMFIARYLGASGLGIIAFAAAFTGLFIVISDMGLGTLTTRDVARDKSLAGRYLNSVLSLRLLLVAVTFGAMVLTVNLMGYSGQTLMVVYIVGAGAAIACLAEVFLSLFRAFEKMEYVSIGRIIYAAAVLGGVFLVIQLNLGIIWIALAFLLADILLLGYSLRVCVTKFRRPKLNVQFSFWKRLLTEGWPIGLFSVVGFIATRIDIVMLAAMKGEETVGFYQAAVTVVIALQFVAVAVISSFFPKISEFYGNNELVSAIAQKMNRILFPIAILLTTGTFFLAPRVIPLVYGAGYGPSVILLQILSLLLFVSYIPADGIVLNAIHKQRLKFYAGVAMASTNVALNLIFIPKYGAVGAAWASIASLVVARICYIMMVRRQGLKTFALEPSLLVITLVGILIGFVFGYALSELNLFLSISLYTAAYLVIAYFFYVKSDEREFIDNMFVKSVSYIAKFRPGSRRNE